MTDPLDGGCACGEVRYRMTSAPLYVHCCHCTACQRETGSAFAVNAMIEADRLVLTSGETEEVLTPSESGKGQRIHRCPTCHVALWSHYALPGALSDRIKFLRVGTLDDPAHIPPDIHIFTRSKQPWVQLPADALAVEVYYDRKECWPEESLRRRAALSGG